MEEMRKVALAYYANCSYEFKQEAKAMFSDIDNNGDGRVSKAEFFEFLRKKNMQNLLNNPKLFDELDRNGDGYLDYEEAIVFIYMGNFGRFSCDKCGQHLESTFFTCPDCFLGANTYDLCVACYGSKRFDHEHRSFIDNHVMLVAARTALQEQLSEDENSYDGGSSTNGRLRKRDALAMAAQAASLVSAGANCAIM